MSEPSSPMMPRAVILAGGKGTRLRPFSITFPKPMVPVGDMPILEILLRQLCASGITDVTLTLGHLAELIRAFITQQSEGVFSKLKISYVTETQPTGTAGSLSLVPGLTDTFLVANGDLLTNLDYRDLIRFHRENGAVLTIASHVNRVKIDLGVLELDGSGRLTNYVEKPEKNYRVSMGVYVYEPSILELIPSGEYLDFPTLVLKLLDMGRPVAVYPFEGIWLDIGRPEDYALAQELYAANPQGVSQCLTTPGKKTLRHRLRPGKSCSPIWTTVPRKKKRSCGSSVPSGLPWAPSPALSRRSSPRPSGVRHAIAVTNGTDALLLSLLALGIQPGDEVVQPAVNFVAAANMTVLAGAPPRLLRHPRP